MVRHWVCNAQANIVVAAAAAKPHSTPYKYVILYTLQETMLDASSVPIFHSSFFCASFSQLYYISS